MRGAIKITAEYIDLETGNTLTSTTISTQEVNKAMTLKDLGYLHIEQIDLIRKIQDFKISHQILLSTPTVCTVCGNKPRKLGRFKSPFHAALWWTQLSRPLSSF